MQVVGGFSDSAAGMEWLNPVPSLLCHPTASLRVEENPKIIGSKPPRRGAGGKDAQPLIRAFGFAPEACPQFIFLANLRSHPNPGTKWGSKSVALGGTPGLGAELRFAALLPSREMLITPLTCISWATCCRRITRGQTVKYRIYCSLN